MASPRSCRCWTLASSTTRRWRCRELSRSFSIACIVIPLRLCCPTPRSIVSILERSRSSRRRFHLQFRAGFFWGALDWLQSSANWSRPMLEQLWKMWRLKRRCSFCLARTTGETLRSLHAASEEKVPRVDLQDGTVAGAMQRMLHMMMQCSRMSMSTTLKRPTRLKRMTPMSMASRRTLEHLGKLKTFTGKKNNLGKKPPTWSSRRTTSRMKSMKRCSQPTWMRGEDSQIWRQHVAFGQWWQFHHQPMVLHHRAHLLPLLRPKENPPKEKVKVASQRARVDQSLSIRNVQLHREPPLHQFAFGVVSLATIAMHVPIPHRSQLHLVVPNPHQRNRRPLSLMPIWSTTMWTLTTLELYVEPWTMEPATFWLATTPWWRPWRFYMQLTVTSSTWASAQSIRHFTLEVMPAPFGMVSSPSCEHWWIPWKTSSLHHPRRYSLSLGKTCVEALQDSDRLCGWQDFNWWWPMDFDFERPQRRVPHWPPQ